MHVMERLSTKTNLERQDEETERLVRPPPKVKPPRHDLRRERVQVDEDPDKEKDPDKSKNYKDVGGSVGAVLHRWAKKRNIPVKNRETGEVVPGGVSPEALRKNPGKYEEIEPEEAEAPTPKKEKKPQPSEEKPTQKAPEADPAETYSALQDLAKGNKAIADTFKALLDSNPMSLGSGVKHAPGVGDQLLVGRFPEVKFPAGIETLGDLQKALEAKPEAPPKKKPEAPPEKPEAPKKPKPEKEAPPAAEEKPKKPPKKKKAPPEGEKPEKAPKKPDRSDEELAAEVAAKWVGKRRHRTPSFQQFLHEVPTGGVDPATGEPLALDPKTRKRVPFEQLDPVAQKALIDEFGVRRQKEVQEEKDVQEKAKKAKEHEDAAKYVEGLDPEIREALDTLGDPNSEVSKRAAELAEAGYDLKDIRPEKLFPELQGKIPEDLESVSVAQNLVRSASEYNAMSVAERIGVGEPQRRPVSDEEREASLSYMMDNLPPDMATSLFERDIHPDDVRELVAHYKEARQREIRDPVEYAQKVAEIYTDDPSQVRPPEQWNGKPFKDLPDEEKAEALRQRQMMVLAVSAAAKDSLAESLSKGTTGIFGGGGVPPILASTLAGSMLLQKAGSSDKTRAAQAKKLGQIVFDTMISHGQHFPMSDKAIKTVMGRLDPHTQEVAKAFFQANDYQAAKDKFLKSGGKLSEFESPRNILREMRAADQFMRDRSASYGGGNIAQEMFRTKVMDKLRVLDPEKYEVVQRQLDRDASYEYDRAHREWERQHEAWLKRKEAFDNRVPDGKPYRDAPKEFDEPEPTEPVKPLRYGAHKKPSRKKGEELWKEVFGQKTASYVAARFVSTYPARMAMGPKSNKSAVYHGVEPEPVRPYPQWQQAHQRDLDEPDFQIIMAKARKWLKTPVLSKHVEGMVPDQQFRAALDYAIQTGIYNRAVNATLYNMLLARLAGWPEPGPEQTLMTIRGSSFETPTSRRPDMTAKTAEQSKYASEICGRFDKLALDIMNHHRKWGMTQEEAKVVVNAIDQAADNFEKAAFGVDSFEKRRKEVVAAVIQRDPDEPYMDNFNNIHQPEQTDSDEPYMHAYDDDQSSAVERGREENGEPLAP